MPQPFVGYGLAVEFGTGSPPADTLNGVTAVTFSGDKVATEKTTTMSTSNGTDTFIASTDDPGSVDIKCWLLPSDASQEAMKAAKSAKAVVPFTVVLPNSLGSRSFSAIVESCTESFPLEKNCTLDIKLKVTGAITETF
ncbi:MAG: hypothetical protein WCC37_25965 [Candidatus Sulfotelmatobacter sp.]